MSATAQCQPGWTWAFNDMGQSPCDMVGALVGSCTNTVVHVEPIAEGMPYSPPQNAGLCWCNTVVYSLSAACTACQGFLPVSWPAWSTTCIAIAANGTCPQESSDIPDWAFLPMKQDGTWNRTQAYNDTSATSLPYSIFTASSSLLSSSQTLSDSTTSSLSTYTFTSSAISSLYASSSSSVSGTSAPLSSSAGTTAAATSTSTALTSPSSSIASSGLSSSTSVPSTADPGSSSAIVTPSAPSFGLPTKTAALTSPASQKASSNHGTAIGIILGSVACLVLVIPIVIVLLRRRQAAATAARSMRRRSASDWDDMGMRMLNGFGDERTALSLSYHELETGSRRLEAGSRLSEAGRGVRASIVRALRTPAGVPSDPDSSFLLSH